MVDIIINRSMDGVLDQYCSNGDEKGWGLEHILEKLQIGNNGALEIEKKSKEKFQRLIHPIIYWVPIMCLIVLWTWKRMYIFQTGFVSYSGAREKVHKQINNLRMMVSALMNENW